MALILTTHGDMDEALLEKKEGVVDNEQEHTSWVEYWLPNGADGKPELVHRSASVQLKRLPSLFGKQESFR
ncbi:MAG TPA: hypothetical protein VNR65_04635 [Geobacterales bacterium]|nr:hypothetical protein [Geobacterales bacterium]